MDVVDIPVQIVFIGGKDLAGLRDVPYLVARKS